MLYNKVIIITESQKNRLFEAATEDFSIEKLEMLNGEDRYAEAERMLGEPYAMGSSRAVFDIDDSTVLKMAYSEGMEWDDSVGTSQNKSEYNVYIQSGENPILPKIYYVSKDFSFMVCERVMPAEEVDFEKYLRIPFDAVYEQNTSDFGVDNQKFTPIGYDKYFKNLKGSGEIKDMFDFNDIALYIEDVYVLDSGNVDDEMEVFIDGKQWLCLFRDLIAKTKISDFDNIGNYGIVNRGGNEMIVLLDTGMDEETGDKYYN